MTSNYDGEISGLMERIQQIRDQRSNIIKGSSAVQPIIVEQLDSKDDHYSEDSSAGSETDSPGSGEFDQLSMHQHDSLFAIVPEVTPKQVSVFSIADFMASVPSAPVAVKQQPSETHQPEKYHENSSSGENVQGQNYDAHREYFQQDANSRETEQPSNLTNNLHDTKGRETMGGLNHHLETPESVRSDGGDETRDMTTASQVVETEMDYYVRESSQLESLTREGSVSSGRSEPSVAHPVVYSHQHHGLSAAAVVDLNKAQDDVVSNPSAAKAIDESSLEAETTEEVEASEYNTQVKGYVPDELVDNMSMHPTTANMIDDESGSNHPGAWNVPAVSTTARKEGSRRNKEALSDKSNAPAAPPSRRGSSSRSLSPRKPGGAGAVLRHSSPPSPSSQDRSNVRSQQRRQHQQEEGEHEREASRSEISSKQDPNAGEANEGEQGEEYALERRRKNSPPRPRSRSPPKPTAAAHPSSSAGASGSGSANSGGSKHRCKTKDITHTHSTLAQASGYRISVSGELDALVQYKASLAMQSQLVDKVPLRTGSGNKFKYF